MLALQEEQKDLLTRKPSNTASGAANAAYEQT